MACVAAGTLHQGKECFPEGQNASCVPSAACAIATRNMDYDFDPATINQVVQDGYNLWVRCKEQQLTSLAGFMFPDQLPQVFTCCGKLITIQDEREWPGGYFPLNGSKGDVDAALERLEDVLSECFSSNTDYTGFIFTGQNVTTSFWESNGTFFLFNSHDSLQILHLNVPSLANKTDGCPEGVKGLALASGTAVVSEWC